MSEIQQRQAAVRELSSSESLCISMLKKLVVKLPDLEKMLCSAYHKKVTIQFVIIVEVKNENMHYFFLVVLSSGFLCFTASFYRHLWPSGEFLYNSSH